MVKGRDTETCVREVGEVVLYLRVSFDSLCFG